MESTVLSVDLYGPVVTQMPPLLNGMGDISEFNRNALIKALRTDQAGKSTFQEFIKASWEAGVVSYDFEGRKVIY